MKFFQFFTFTLLAAISAALLIVGMATLHWVTTNNNSQIGLSGFGQTHSGLRRYYNEINGDSTDSSSFNRGNCDGIQSAQCDLHQSGSWGLGWGIGALACIALAFVMVALISCVTLFRGTRGKFTAAFLMFLAFACTLVGALTYWSHLPDLSNSSSYLSWSFILYCIGSGVALLTSIVLCLLPTRHYYSTTTVVTQPTVYTNNTTTTTTTAYPVASTASVAATSYPVGSEAHAIRQPLSPKYPGYTTSSQPSYPVEIVSHQTYPDATTTSYPASYSQQQPVSVVVQ